MLRIWTSLQLCHTVAYFLTISQMKKKKIQDPSKLKEFADDNFRLDENGRKFSVMAESSLFFHSVFERLILQTCENNDLIRQG